MRILVAGGGSGGHVTPVAAVIQEIKRRHPRAEIRMWCDAKFLPQTRSIFQANSLDAVRIDTVAAGKLRRYHNLPIWRQLLRPVTIVGPNLRDMSLVAAGVVQSICKMIAWRPDVVFTKGGYVCLPIGLAAHLLRIPLVIHDSDAHPGLTNRILARFATTIATGAPLENYPYPRSRSRYVGIPIASEFREYSDAEVVDFKKKHGFDTARPLIIVTGGGLGARRLNEAVMKVRSDICRSRDLLLVAGKDHYGELQAMHGKHPVEGFHLRSFISQDIAEIMAAADIVVARAGATSVLELAALKKPTILVPNRYLTGGHQLKNARMYESAGAVKVLDETQLTDQPHILPAAITAIESDKKARRAMANMFGTFARPNAASDMTDCVLAAIRRK